ncbi:MAG: UTP--glucose-1-phosphate uridylyltransferase [Candidatus Marinimicrobia bacterium]|nr:UTP--glucose-1-phosphate uridylyltransferase [Candidatus Neomarinimicrobiota bacterium]
MENKKIAIREKMQAHNIHEIGIQNFMTNYEKFINGHSSLISKINIKNPDNILNLNDIPQKYGSFGEKALPGTVMIKLNGGLGTSMGLKKAKSLLVVKNRLTFLDIIARQSEAYNVPLILMNSFNTQKESIELLKKYKKLNTQKLPLEFLQNKVPKIGLASKGPVLYEKDENLEWCPPGHGDIFISLLTSDTLEKLLNVGIEYAFISNADNLGATMDLKILGYFSEKKIPFLMEVAERTESDKKGGHLAENKQGCLILREVAQCPMDELDDFQNFSKYTYFNTNNIWVNLKSLRKKFAEKDNNLDLPLIINTKTVDPRDENSEKVVQLETAMGSAIEIFDKAEAVCVPRSRFIPVKKTEDLLKIQSNLYKLDKKCNLVPQNTDVINRLIIELDDKYYKLIDDFQANFGEAEIDFIDCYSLKIKGKICLKGKYKFVGNVEIMGN